MRGELRSVRSGLQRNEQDLQRAITRGRRSCGPSSRRCRPSRIDCARDCAEAEVGGDPLVAQIEAAEQARIAAEAAFERCTAERQSASEQASRSAARVEALQLALDAARERAGAERLADVEGVLGTLLELVDIDDGWQAAVEAALGEALTAVVVDGPDVGAAGLGRPRGIRHERRRARRRRRAGVAPTAPAVGEAVLPHVRSARADLSGLLAALVGRAVRVDDLAAAVDAAIAHPDAMVVTPDGDRFASTGWRVGAASGGATASALTEATERPSSRSRAGWHEAETALAGARSELDGPTARRAQPDPSTRPERRPVHGRVRGPRSGARPAP